MGIMQDEKKYEEKNCSPDALPCNGGINDRNNGSDKSVSGYSKSSRG